MEAALRFSRNSSPGDEQQRFLRVDVTGKSFRLCNLTKESKRQAQYDVIHTSTKVPAFRAFDWHPVRESLIAVGGSGGDATLLNIAEGQQDSLNFSARSQRLCNAVALSTEHLIAVGLDRVRTDFCLNIWDFNQRVSPSAPSRTYAKGYSEPLHKLAGGEPISSLKFYNSDPQLLIAGVKGQFVRLYDLREQPAVNTLQFATRCVHNLAIDARDENYFASCFPTGEQLVCVWDKRMSNKAYATHNTFGNVSQSVIQPEPSLELTDVTDSPGIIWSLRFSKYRRGCLGMLLSSGHLRVYDTAQDFTQEVQTDAQDRRSVAEHLRHSQDIYLEGIQDIEKAYSQDKRSNGEKKRIVSFDFMTSGTKRSQPKLIVLTGEGNLKVTSLKPAPEPLSFSSAGFMCKGQALEMVSTKALPASQVAKTVDRVRRTAEPRNPLKLAFKRSKQNKSTSQDRPIDLRRMSSFANQSWNADLGFYEKKVPLEDLLTLLAAPRLRCEAGYLLDASKNKTITTDSQWVEAFWSWVDRAERISRNGMMVQDNLDLSFIGVHGIWMEEIATKSRQRGASFSSVSSVIKNFATRLNLPPTRGCQTAFPWHRKLCLHVAGLAWSRNELETMVQRNISSGQHTKAAALAIFAEEEKLAFKALRSRTATQSHKMLAMAIAGAAKRRKRASKSDSSSSEGSVSEDDSDWAETISSLSSDLADPYARAILAYVKSGNWEDVVNEEALPLKQRVGVALRHLSDNELTSYIGRMTREVIINGDIEGVILTGTGTKEGLELLQSYARAFSDLQTAILGLSVGGAAGRFSSLTSSASSAEEKSWIRRVEAMRESYRRNIMSWGLKFDRVRFDVASARALNSIHASAASSTSVRSNSHAVIPRPKEQIRLICSYCTQSLMQFPSTEVHNGQPYPKEPPQPHHGQYSHHQHGHNSSIGTMSSQATAEKAAVVGTVCPKCGRHLPRCGVCDLWLGMPDETYSKWYTDSLVAQQKHGAGENGSVANRTGSPASKRGSSVADRKASAGTTTSNTNTLSKVNSNSNSNNNGTEDPEASMTASVSTVIGPAASNAGPGPVSTSTSTSTTKKSTLSSSSSLSSSKPTRTADTFFNTETATMSEIPVPISNYVDDDDKDNNNEDEEYQRRTQEQAEKAEQARKWRQVMHKFTVFCVVCSHGFHAEHAKMWFEGDSVSGREGHRVCPVAGCVCHCNG